MHKLSGGCHCGNIQVDLELPHAPETYNPRACDCDFCRKHSASYLSDSGGSLVIRLRNEQSLKRYRQGAEIADCLLCANCGVLVGIYYQSEERGFAAVNSKAIEGCTFGERISVSPKALSASEKAERWKTLWFQNVKIII